MKKCCLGTLISILVVVVLIAVAIIVVLNMTPAQLHVDEISLGGSTMAELGLSDVKLIKIVKGVKALNKKESDVVKNGYDAEEENTAATSFFENSNLSGNYGSLLDNAVTFDGRYALVMNDTTLAYVFDKVLATVYTSGEDAVPTLSVRELTITKATEEETGASTGHIRLVVGINVDRYIPDTVTGTVDKVKVVKVPEYVYLVFESDFDVISTGANQGKIVFGTPDVFVGGDKENVLNDVFVKIVAKAMGVEGETAEGTKQALCSEILDKLASSINHVGAIGTAYTNVSGVVTGSVTYGMAGVDNGLIRFVTNELI